MHSPFVGEDILSPRMIVHPKMEQVILLITNKLYPSTLRTNPKCEWVVMEYSDNYYKTKNIKL